MMRRRFLCFPVFQASRSLYVGVSGKKCDAPPTGKLKFRKPLSLSVVENWKRSPKNSADKLVMVTAYDAPGATMAALAGVDLILVGDSLGMVVQGKEGTITVEMSDMESSCAAVVRGLDRVFVTQQIPERPPESLRRPLVVGDMPFGSYISENDAVLNAMKLMKYGNADCVKLEGGREMAGRIKSIAANGIKVMGHIGLTPQTCGRDFALQGKTVEGGVSLVEDALALQAAGCFAVVLECVPADVAAACEAALRIPTIGIGAGKMTTGQVLVYHDLLGLYPNPPKFSKQWANLRSITSGALASYAREVRSTFFPTEDHTTFLGKDQCSGLQSELENRGYHAAAKGVELLRSERYPRLALDDVAPSAATDFSNGILIVGGGSIGGALAAHFASCPKLQNKIFLKSRRFGSNSKVSVIQHGKEAVDVSLHCHDLGAVSLVILAHKQTSSVEAKLAAAAARSVLKENPDAIIVAMQNGVLDESIFESDGDILRKRMVAAVTYIASRQTQTDQSTEAECRVKVSSVGPTYLGRFISAFDGGAVSDVKLHQIASLFSRVGLPAHVTSETDGQLSFPVAFWRKIAVNAVINTLTAVLDVPNGDLDMRDSISLSSAMISEIVPVANASLQEAYSRVRSSAVGKWRVDEEEMQKHVVDAIRLTGGNSSSMREDINRARPTESDAIAGFILAEAQRHELRTPTVEALHRLVLAKSCAGQAVLGNSKSAVAHPPVVDSVANIRAKVAAIRQRTPGARIGFIPTMGALHAGHLSLVQLAKMNHGCDYVIVSIFVNPEQFAPNEDLTSYPRTVASDLEKLQKHGCCDLVFAPRDVRDMYPKDFKTFVVPRGMAMLRDEDVAGPVEHGAAGSYHAEMLRHMPEGCRRPGFFRGVATVVTKLLNIVRPDVAVFGQKDAQQCVVVRRLAADLDIPTQIVIGPTVRENDGLAMSSRNAYLSQRQRKYAAILFSALTAGSEAWIQDSDDKVRHTRDAVCSILTKAKGVEQVEYVSIADASGIEISKPPVDKSTVCLSVAVTMTSADGEKPVRLLDNVFLN